MKIPVFLALGATALLAPTAAQAQLPPGLNPGVTNQAAQRAQQSDVLYWYNLLPTEVFGAFNGADRVELLRGQDAIYDKNRGFIEVPVPGDPNENDVEKLQIKLYQGQQGIMVGVSQIVWNQPRVQGALAFFALDNNGQLLPVTRQVFPYDLTPAPGAPAPAAPAPGAPADPAAAKTATVPVNAYLPRNGTTIETGVPETKTRLADYRWNNQVFVERRAPAGNTPANDAPAGPQG